jgi:type IV secretory pathway VirB3-like protein
MLQQEAVPQALTRRLLVLGLPRKLGILIITLTAISAFHLHAIEPVLIGIFFLAVGNAIHKHDQYMFEVAKSHFAYKARYIP